METKHIPHGRGTSAQGTTPPYVPQIRLYQQWLHATRGLQFDSYDALWRWSVTDLDAFWQSVWDYFDLQSPTPHTGVLAKNTMPGAQMLHTAPMLAVARKAIMASGTLGR